MENGKRNQIISFLLVVGISFIVVSGTIFTTNAWKYLPESIRQCILLLLSMGLFAGAGKASQNKHIQKTETALYYLGSSFLGLFVLLVCGGIVKTGGMGLLNNIRNELNTGAVLAASIVMLFPVSVRFFRKRSAFDFICMALLADFVIFWIMLFCHMGVSGSCIISAAGLSIYTVAHCLRKKWQMGNQKMELAFLVLYLLHVVTFCMHLMTLVIIHDKLFMKGCFWIVMMFVILNTALLYKAEKQTVFRVLNSLGTFLWLISGVYFLDELLRTVCYTDVPCPWGADLLQFLAFTLCAVCMAFLMRIEMVLAITVVGMYIPFCQIFSYGGYHFLFSTYSHKVSTYLPFSGVLVITMAVVLWRLKRNGTIGKEKIRQYAVVVALQIPVMMILFLASKYPFFKEGIWSMLAIECFASSYFFTDKTGRSVFQTLALCFLGKFAEISAANWITENYRTEYICFLAAVALFLLGRIWGRESRAVFEGIRITQFVGACCIALILLFHVFCVDEIANGLILGITSAGMLLLSAIYNIRQYVVLASIVLLLLVFYLTRSFWLSIAWWVYLFIVGVIMVIVAIKYEKK